MTVRNVIVNLAFGQPTRFNETKTDVFRHYMFFRQEENVNGATREALAVWRQKTSEDLFRR